MYAFLLQELSPEPTRHNTDRTVHDLQQAFAQDNLEQVRDILDSVLADLPYETFDKTSEGLFHGKRVLVIGVHFDGQERRIAGWEVEAL